MNAYEEDSEDSDLDDFYYDEIYGDSDFFDIQLIFYINRSQRTIKYQHGQMNWENHLQMLRHVNDFDGTYRMSEHAFNVLLEGIRDEITVNILQSNRSTSGNEPIYPEIILAMCLRFLIGDTVRVLSHLFGVSMRSCRRVIKVTLHAIDNATIDPLKISLPQSSEELSNLAQRWSSISTSYGLFDGHIRALGRWLAQIERPNVPNQADYFSGHCQCSGLNIQALCDPDLIFNYVCIAAPGKTNDARAFGRCTGVVDWLDNLPDQYFISGDNAYILSKKILIPFSGPTVFNEIKRTYNYYLSQLRIRVEMPFGLLTTKWRRLRTKLNFLQPMNALIIRVCFKLHNYCIRMSNVDSLNNDNTECEIEPYISGTNETYEFGFLPTNCYDDDTFPFFPVATLTQLVEILLLQTLHRVIQRPLHNIIRNND